MKKVAIITFHNAINYGAILQCYALQNYIENKFKYSVEILNYTPQYFREVFFDPLKPLSAYGMNNKIKALAKFVLRHDEIKALSKKNKDLLLFIKNNLHLVPMHQNSYDYYVAGSDQIWNLELLKGDTTYLLDFVISGKKIAYAASFKIADIDDYARKMYQKYLPSFNCISVRESDLQVYLKSQYGIESTCVLDPTLLIGADFWRARIKGNPLISKKYLLIYFVNMPVHLIEDAFVYAEKHNLEIVSLNKIKGKKNYINFSSASIENFLNLISNAEVVFTTSFHGMAFSILFEREFYYETPYDSYNNNNRLIDLSIKLGLQTQDLDKTDYKDINWSKVRELLLMYRQNSELFLIDSLEG